MIITKRNVSVILTSLLLILSCAKERETQYVQTFPEDAVKKEALQSNEYTLQTFEEVSGDSFVSNANLIEVEENNLGFADLRRVRYETDAPFFENVPFVGRPNTTYTLRYEIKLNKLIISRVGKAQDFPFNERIAAEKLPDGRLKAPMISYNIEVLKEERILNENNEETHQITAIKANSVAEATHIKVDRTSRNLDFMTFNNVFKSDLLAGEWFFAATVVSASPEQANSIGRDVSMDFKARSVSRIKFIKYEDSIVGQNLNVDENIDASDDINLKEAISIPAKYFDVRKSGYDDIVKNPSARVDDEDNQVFRRPFEKREFMELDFKSALSAMTRNKEVKVCSVGEVDGEDGEKKKIKICNIETKPGLSIKRATLDSLEVAQDYLAFVVYHKAEKVKIRYSLRKAHTPKEGRTYFEDDRKVFGFFGSTKFAILNHRYERKDAREKLTFLNRFYPENGRIVYYFSKRTPDHMKEAGRLAIKVWDKAFQEAETGIRVTLDESKSVNLGDIRYNIINIVDTKDGARLLGYGPSIVDSESGEIISATSNIYANPFRESWINTLRNYVRSQIGMFKANEIGVPSPEKMTFYTDFVEDILNYQEKNYLFLERQNSLSSLLNGSEKVNNNLKEILSIKDRLLEKGQFLNDNHSHEEGIFHFNAFDRTNKDSINEIKRVCGSSIEDYIQTLKNLRVTHTDEELRVLNTCANKLLQNSVVATLIHELGHNFGLRHNFMASTDTKNFIVDKDGEVPAATSSVMDYQPSNVRELMVPGPYDVAAIRFGYANKVALKDGSSINISKEESLNSQVDNKSTPVIEFKYCTDEDVQKFDPLCQRHDDGRNPLEIVKNTIDNFYSSYAVYGNRYDKAKGPDSDTFAMNHFQRTFIPLKLIHDQWRHHLREYLRTDSGNINTFRATRGTEKNIYLEDFSSEDFKAMLERMKNSQGKYSQIYKDYFEASEIAYNFLKEIVFTPAKMCVGKPKNSGPDTSVILIDFEEVKEGIFSSTNMTIDSCDHILANDYLEDLDLDYVGSFGQFYEEQKESLDIRDIDYRLTNTVGFEKLRRMALLALTMRAPLMEHLKEKNFLPNFLDNPLHRKEITNLTFTRIINGLDASPYGFKNSAPFTQSIFVREKSFLRDLAASVVKAITIPNDITNSGKRTEEFRPERTTNPNIIDRPMSVITNYRHFFIYKQIKAKKDRTTAQKMIEKHIELTEILKKIDLDKVEFPKHLAFKTKLSLESEKKLLPLSEVRSMRVLEFFNYILAIDKNAKIQEDIGQPFVAEIIRAHIRGMLVRLHNTISGEGATQEEREKINNMNIFELVKSQEEDQKGLTINDLKFSSSDFIMEGLQPLVEKMKEQREKGRAVIAYKKEIEAHLDLLTLVLMTL